MALGALPRDIYRVILKRGFALVAIGIAIGLAGTAAITRLLAAFLFGVTPHDPATIVSVMLLFTAVALLACGIPARRATSVDPMIALRHE
jgi:putative ABC transport system permease protein